MMFNNKEELLLAAKAAKIHEAVYEWMEQRSLEDIFTEMSFRNRVWCLRQDWEQFAAKCNWDRLHESEQSYFSHCMPHIAAILKTSENESALTAIST